MFYAMNSSNQATNCGEYSCMTEIINRQQKRKRPTLLWEGTNSTTEIQRFKLFIKEKYGLQFDSNESLHQWSVNSFEQFWEAVWIYFNVIASQTYEKIFFKTGPKFLDNEWFFGARFNYAENLLRIRDNSVALMYADEEDNYEEVTFAELFNEVELYAAAFRKNGLEKGDRVACHISNRKEAIFALLAAASIGAMWGGAIPYLGARAAANIISKMEPKFLITVDRLQDNGKDIDIISNLPTIVECTPSLEKVIIVTTKAGTSSRNISHIKNSCFLRDFLKTGKRKDGSVPSITFEQLPSSHPIFLTFTSGTTGISKGPVHSTAVLLSTMAYVSFIYNLKRDDTLFCCCPMGWSPLINYVSCLALGIRLFLYNGNSYYVTKSGNFWDIVARYKVNFVFQVASAFDKWDKIGLIPNPKSNFEHLKVIAISSCCVKDQNVAYIRNHITKHAFIGDLYAATESMCAFTGFYLDSPSYYGECQLPALGIDLRCVNRKGDSVTGEVGHVVIATPTPSLPSYLWKDINGTILNKEYLSLFPDMWSPNDMAWINPETGGIKILGRSDDTFVQNGDRFGSADVYFAIHKMEEIDDYICVGQKRFDGDERAILFVKMRDGYDFTPSLREKIKQRIEDELFEDCVPKLVLNVKDIPYNVNNKRMESIVRKIIETNTIPEATNIKNPESLKYFCNIPEICNYNTANGDL